MAQNVVAVTIGLKACTCLLPVNLNNVMCLKYKYQDFVYIYIQNIFFIYIFIYKIFIYFVYIKYKYQESTVNAFFKKFQSLFFMLSVFCLS